MSTTNTTTTDAGAGEKSGGFREDLDGDATKRSSAAEDSVCFGCELFKEGKIRITQELRRAIMITNLGGEKNPEPLLLAIEDYAVEEEGIIANHQKKLNGFRKQIAILTANGKEDSKRCKGLERGFENVKRLRETKIRWVNRVRKIDYVSLFDVLMKICGTFLNHITREWRSTLLRGYLMNDAPANIVPGEDGDKYEAVVIEALEKACAKAGFKVLSNVHLSAPSVLIEGQKTEFDVLVVEEKTKMIVAILEVKRAYYSLTSGTGNIPFQAFGPERKYELRDRGRIQMLQLDQKRGDTMFLASPVIFGVGFLCDRSFDSALKQLQSEIVAWRSFYRNEPCDADEEEASEARERTARDGTCLKSMKLFQPQPDGSISSFKGVTLKHSEGSAIPTSVRLTCKMMDDAGRTRDIHPRDMLKCAQFCDDWWTPDSLTIETRKSAVTAVAAVANSSGTADDDMNDESGKIEETRRKGASKDEIATETDDAPASDATSSVELRVRATIERALRAVKLRRQPLVVPKDLLEDCDYSLFCKTIVNHIASCKRMRKHIQSALAAQYSKEKGGENSE